jgi:hypothetical protein
VCGTPPTNNQPDEIVGFAGYRFSGNANPIIYNVPEGVGTIAIVATTYNLRGTPIDDASLLLKGAVHRVVKVTVAKYNKNLVLVNDCPHIDFTVTKYKGYQEADVRKFCNDLYGRDCDEACYRYTLDEGNSPGVISCVPHTQAPTESPTEPSATAIGDPHLVNALGEHFSIFKSGQVEFLRVPFEAVTEEADFTLHATLESFGKTDECGDAVYITQLRFGGSRFEGKALEVSVDQIHPGATKKEMKVFLGGVPVLPSLDSIILGEKMTLELHNNNQLVLEVGEASVRVDLQYFFLNVEANAYTKLAEKIGGLLGQDSHAEVSVKREGCEAEFLEAARLFSSSAVMTA